MATTRTTTPRIKVNVLVIHAMDGGATSPCRMLVSLVVPPKETFLLGGGRFHLVASLGLKNKRQKHKHLKRNEMKK